MRPKLLALASLALFTLVVASPALADNGGIAPQNPQSPNAEGITDLYWLLVAVAGAIFLLVEGALILFIVKYRNRGRPREAEGPQIRGHTRLEIAWTALPVVILAAILAFTFYKLPGIKNVPGAPADLESGALAAVSSDRRLNIDVVGHQFYWQFRYPNGVIAVNRMRAPVGRVVTLDITAPDVVHSWWVPELTGKLDNVPGHTNLLHFEPTRTGRFDNGKCGEFCGIEHAEMLTSVIVTPADEFDAWVEEAAREQEAPSAQFGKEVYEAACAKCHGFDGEGDVGPPIAGIPTLTNRDALRRLLLRGQNTDTYESYMPPVGRGWPEHQYDAFIEYVKSNPKLSRREGG